MIHKNVVLISTSHIPLKFTKMNTYLLNPFVKIAGTKALLIGLGMILVVAVLNVYSPSHFDGVLDLHFTELGKRNWTKLILISIAENVINLITLGIVFSISAFLLVGTRFRVIDIFGTMAYARFPLYLISLLNVGGFNAAVSGKFVKGMGDSGIPELEISEWAIFLFSLVFTILGAVWVISLFYKAYTVSTGLKGAKAIVSFIIALILAEVVSKIIHHAIIPSLL